ncbi:hypothetical protein Cgig2_024628 [Carnegiea gigantea]|uniref:Uncharacterized protein n=1 Tax=Carnegiea gigantea TaxID=171969 RepID=A0A9Q1QE88_9CARY|nr:hypothetical protein Cgig2_024628 [Carnegiea gigantea]
MDINGDFPSRVTFMDELGMLVIQELDYESKPLKCNHSIMFGHVADQCRKGQMATEYKEANVELEGLHENTVKDMENQEGEIAKRCPGQCRTPAVGITTRLVLQNSFGSLQTMDRLAIWYVRQPNGLNKQEAVKGFLAQNKGGIIGILETKTRLRREDDILQQIQHSWNTYVTVVYGAPDNMERKEFWDALCGLSQYINDPWVTGDDFNSLLRVKEIIGGDLVLIGEILDFATCIDNCGAHKSFSRFDRVLVNEEGIRYYPRIYYEVLSKGLSDHTPLLIHFYKDKVLRQKSFKFYNMCGFLHTLKTI